MKNLIALAFVLVGSSAMAASYGDAGCGLGAMVLGSQKGWTQVFGATLNGTSGNQTFGITSGTSNCVDSGAVSENSTVPHYVEVNRYSLAKEAARGGGETVAGLAHLLSCDAQVLGKNLQQNYDNVFVKSNMEPAQIEASARQACGV